MPLAIGILVGIALGWATGLSWVGILPPLVIGLTWLASRSDNLLAHN